MDSFTNNILLSNLTRIRWIAIIGQFLAIIFVFYYLNIEIPIYPCLLVILISVLINSYSFLNNKADKYLSDKQAFSFLIFDTIQLSILLFLTQYLYIPFFHNHYHIFHPPLFFLELPEFFNTPWAHCWLFYSFFIN